MSNKIIIVSLSLALVIAFGFWLTLPKNYDDCVLKYLKDANTDLAVRAIAQACDNKFSKKVK
ncbi:MAG TPA: hypothetical protein EYQ26_02860 [Rhodospirillales bacterium]|jgi:hypothetical protein|nr:hypothetical protein [Rhodospirillales bacterium]